MQDDVTRDLNLATTLCVCDLFSRLPDVALFAGLCKTGPKQMPPAVSLAKAIVNPQLIEKQTKPNQTKNQTERTKTRQNEQTSAGSLCRQNNNSQCCWHTVMHTIFSPGHSSARALAVGQLTMDIFLPLLLLLPRSCPHTTSLMALMKLADCTRSSLESQSFSASVAPRDQSCSLTAPELLCKRGS